MTLDKDQTVLAAEVVFALRHEYAVTLTDIVHRRLMTGLSADQGARLSAGIAAIAARESNWNSAEKDRQLAELRQYNTRLRLFSAFDD